jgi:hypothetical protein
MDINCLAIEAPDLHNLPLTLPDQPNDPLLIKSKLPNHIPIPLSSELKALW